MLPINGLTIPTSPCFYHCSSNISCPICRQLKHQSDFVLRFSSGKIIRTAGYFAISAESTMDMNLVSSESVREVSTTGALVPMTMAASSALASWASVL
jgi:hypothetical protein